MISGLKQPPSGGCVLKQIQKEPPAKAVLSSHLRAAVC